MKILCLIAGMLLALVGCSSPKEMNEERIEQAAAELAEGDGGKARSLLDEVLSTTPGAGISASQFARLSILYMRLSETADTDDNTATAFTCYLNAYKANPDSAAAYYASVGDDDARYVQLLASLRQIMENPQRNNFPDHEEEPESEE